MNLLYIAPLLKYDNSYNRLLALNKLDAFNVKCIPSNFSNLNNLYLNKFVSFAEKRVLDKYIKKYLNNMIFNIIKKNSFNVIWLDKSLFIDPYIYKYIKDHTNSKIYFFSPDDFGNSGNVSSSFYDSIKYIDKIFTTKSYNVDELYSKGANEVIFLNNHYCHFLITHNSKPTNNFISDISFIGTYERDRTNSIEYLIANNLNVSVFGDWTKYRNNIIKAQNKLLTSHNYSNYIYKSKINLAFLRKVNRDLQTTRTVEIPAYLGFMLGERTNEHLSLFKEGIEAEFFSNDLELLDKCKFYLSRDLLRNNIALGGYNKIIKMKLSNIDFWHKIFNI